MDDNDTPESRRRLSDQEIEEIKKQLLDSIYADIGKSVIKKVLWVGGIVLLAVFAWLAKDGKINISS